MRYAIVLTILPERTRPAKPRACILETAEISRAENDAHTAPSFRGAVPASCSFVARVQIGDGLVNLPGLPAVSQFHFWQTKSGQNHMNTSEIDSAILSAVGEHWTKIAMVIARVADTVSHDLPPGDEGYEVISRRIEALVHDGRLLAQGDTKNWRFSEVRLKPN